MTHHAPVQSSAPGSLMLFGEHAVLHGRRALCAALQTRIHVRLERRRDREIHLHSALGSWRGTLGTQTPQAPFQFVLEALNVQAPQTGLDLRIESEFSSTVGFGSSAAVTVATLAALHEAQGEGLDRSRLFLQAREVIRRVQGRGSGADAAAATYGGVVAYRADPVEIETLSAAPPIRVFYCGYKTATAQVIQRVEQLRARHPALYERIFDAMDACVGEAVRHLRQGDWEQVGALMNLHQGLQDALGTCDATLANLVYALRSGEGILGSKISGSGLGDCVVALGETAVSVPAFEELPAAIGLEGVRVERP